MKIHSAMRMLYALVDTSIGEFKIYQDGSITRWDAARFEFGSFDVDRFDVADIDLIREAGLALLT